MTAQQYAKRMKAREKVFLPALAATTKGIGRAALKLSKEHLSIIYSIPEDVTKKGKKKWRRTGHLRRSEQVQVRGPVEVAIINNAAYAEPRHEAGKPNRRRINPIRVVHWRDEMDKVMRPIAREQWKETIRDVIRQKGL